MGLYLPKIIFSIQLTHVTQLFCLLQLSTLDLNKLVRASDLVFFLQSLHEKKMTDNEKKFEARLDQQKSDITAQVLHVWLLC
jgi:hypothetical protein